MEAPTTSRERFSVCTETELKERIANSTPDGTRKKVKWALNVLKEWQNETLNDESRLHMYGDIETSPASTINNELKHFILEVRKKDGSRYPPKTLYDLIVMLNYYLMKEVGRDINLMKDKEFLETRMSMNTSMTESADEGLIAGTNASEPISQDEEDLLFESGILGSSSTKHILNTAIYLLAVHTSVRGGAELRNLKAGENSQFRLQHQDGEEVLIYKETKAKNYQGNAKSLRKNPPPECVIHHNPNHDRCCVCFYKRIILGRPQNCKTNSLFLKELVRPKGDILFTNVPLGYHTLDNIISTITAGLQRRYTNQSARKTAPTRLYQHDVPEQIIMEQTRHQSLIVRNYKKTNNSQLQQKSKAIYGNLKEQRKPCTCTSTDISSEPTCSEDSPRKKMKIEFDGNQNKIIVTFE